MEIRENALRKNGYASREAPFFFFVKLCGPRALRVDPDLFTPCNRGGSRLETAPWSGVRA